jgi:hypothetical protein
MAQDQNQKRRWQNLLHKKCPNCNTHLEDCRLYFKCPNPHHTDIGRNCFFIKKDRAAEFLLNPEHPANKCLNRHERETLEDTIQELIKVA